MDQFDTDIFQFRHAKEELPPSDYVIKQIESLAELGLSEEEALKKGPPPFNPVLEIKNAIEKNK